MNNYCVRKADYFIKFSKKIPQFFIIHQRSDFILHYSFFQAGLLLHIKYQFCVLLPKEAVGKLTIRLIFILFLIL